MNVVIINHPRFVACWFILGNLEHCQFGPRSEYQSFWNIDKSLGFSAGRNLTFICSILHSTLSTVDRGMFSSCGALQIDSVGLLLKLSLISWRVSSYMGSFPKPNCRLTLSVARNLLNHALILIMFSGFCLYVIYKFPWMEINFISAYHIIHWAWAFSCTAVISAH